MRVTKRLVITGAIVVASASLAPLAIAEQEKPAPRIATRAGEFQAVTANGYLAWVRDSRHGRSQLYLRTPSGKVTHVNRPGTRALLGAISGRRLVFQEYTKRKSTIRFMNVKSGRSWDAPRAINAPRTHEYQPVMSGKWLAFGRFHPGGWFNSMVVYNLNTGRSQRLWDSEGSTEPPYMQPGQLSGNKLVYVLWHRGQQSLLVAHDLKKRDVSYVVGDRYLWAPSIREDGTVYALETGRKCGSKAKLLRFPHFDWGYDGSETLVRLPDGVDSAHTSTYIDEAGLPRVLFQRARCSARSRASDIYELTDATRLTVNKEGLGMGTVTSSPQGIACGDECTAQFGGSTSVTLTAEAETGSTFEGWSGPCYTDEPTCVITVHEDTEVTASFDLGP